MKKIVLISKELFLGIVGVGVIILISTFLGENTGYVKEANLVTLLTNIAWSCYIGLRIASHID